MDTEHDNPEAEGESSIYIEFMKEQALTHEKDLERTIRDRGRSNWMLFVLVCFLGYANIYQLWRPLPTPLINNVDSHGQVVTRLLLRPDEIPTEDPLRAALIKNYLERYVQNARARPNDVSFMVKGINSAFRMSAGPALTALNMAVAKEKPLEMTNRKIIEVEMPKSPAYLVGNSWQAEWVEIIKGSNNMELRRETRVGTFEVATQAEWVTDKNPLGLRVVNYTDAAVSK